MHFGNREKNAFLFFSFRYRHGFASARGTVVLSRETRPCLSVSDRKTKHIFCFFPSARGTVLLPQEARLCFREKYVCASWKRKRKHFFPSVRGMELIPSSFWIAKEGRKKSSIRHAGHACVPRSKNTLYMHACYLVGWCQGQAQDFKSVFRILKAVFWKPKPNFWSI